MKKSFFSHNTYEVSHVKRRIFLCILVFSLLTTPALAKSDYIRWVDFDVDYSAMQRALEPKSRRFAGSIFLRLRRRAAAARA